MLLLSLTEVPVQGQSLIEQYRAARLKKQAERILREHGGRLAPRPPVALPGFTGLAYHQEAVDTTFADTTAAVEPPKFLIAHRDLVRRLGRPWFEKKYKDTAWAYLGGNHRVPLDTMLTREVRARMQAQFGHPTRTLAELNLTPDTPEEAYIQFEYWFVVNDTIPLIVMDVNGPFERGVVVAGDHRHRDLLFEVRQALFEAVVNSDVKEPYVDYYYNPTEKAWYKTGYDGNEYFLEHIRRPRLERGRPWLPRKDYTTSRN